MKARFPGNCPGGDRIAVGDEIVRNGPGGWRHPGHQAAWQRPASFAQRRDDRRMLADGFEDEGNAAERRMLDQEYAAGIEDANRERFNRQMFGEEYAAAEEYARDLRGLNGDW